MYVSSPCLAVLAAAARCAAGAKRVPREVWLHLDTRGPLSTAQDFARIRYAQQQQFTFLRVYVPGSCTASILPVRKTTGVLACLRINMCVPSCPCAVAGKDRRPLARDVAAGLRNTHGRIG